MPDVSTADPLAPSEAESAMVVLLDAAASPIGVAPKLEAHHAPGLPHLAFSVVLHDTHGRLLLQRRSRDKHHFRRCWANTCCSHPQPGESVRDAAARRVREELRITLERPVEPVGAFWYQAVDPDSGLVEVEYDVVLRGRLTTDAPVLEPDRTEVDALRWVTIDQARSLTTNSHDRAVAPWLTHVLSVLDDGSGPISTAIDL